MTAPMQAALLERAGRLSAKRDRVAAWATFDLLNLAASDDELPLHLRTMYPELARQLPNSSLWAIKVDPVLHSRRAATRALLALEAAPELVQRVPTTGLDSGKGLGAGEGMSVGPILEVGLLSSAPGTLGLLSTRLPGIVGLLFGQLEAGRDPSGDPADLIDLYRPRLLSTPIAGPIAYPKLSSALHEGFFEWWLERSSGAT